MSLADALLLAGVLLTVMHVGCDAYRFAAHMRHWRDWFTVVSLVALVGHVVLTGELAEWASMVS